MKKNFPIVVFLTAICICSLAQEKALYDKGWVLKISLNSNFLHTQNNFQPELDRPIFGAVRITKNGNFHEFSLIDAGVNLGPKLRIPDGTVINDRHANLALSYAFTWNIYKTGKWNYFLSSGLRMRYDYRNYPVTLSNEYLNSLGLANSVERSQISFSGYLAPGVRRRLGNKAFLELSLPVYLINMDHTWVKNPIKNSFLNYRITSKNQWLQYVSADIRLGLGFRL